LIAILISGATLRAIVPALTGRQVREGARMVNVFINSARNRAVQLGRPAGVWLDRFNGNNEACMSLAFAAVPPPYSGDYTDSALEAFIIPTAYGQDALPGRQYYLNVVVASSLTYPRTGTTPTRPETWSMADGSQKFVRPGDLLQMNLQGEPYRLFSDSDLGGPFWVIAVGVNNTYLVSGKTRVGPSGPWASNYFGASHRYYISWFNDLGVPTTPYVTPGSTATHFGTPVPYQIKRQPMRMSAGSMQLPESVCIDLNFSGTIDNTINYNGGFRPFHPRFNPSDSSVPPSPYQGTAYDPTDQTPVIIMFNPMGSIEQMYCRWWIQGTNASNSPYVWRGDYTLSPVNLLVGQMAKVPNFGGTTNTTQLLTTNAADPANVWVTIHPTTGEVTSNEVHMIQPGNTIVGDLRNTGGGGVLWQSASGTVSGDTMGGR
jgi:hypothetical protein